MISSRNCLKCKQFKHITQYNLDSKTDWLHSLVCKTCTRNKRKRQKSKKKLTNKEISKQNQIEIWKAVSELDKAYKDLVKKLMREI